VLVMADDLVVEVTPRTPTFPRRCRSEASQRAEVVVSSNCSWWSTPHGRG